MARLFDMKHIALVLAMFMVTSCSDADQLTINSDTVRDKTPRDEEPIDEPTEDPTEEPTEEPTEDPTDEPTEDPTENPTEAPTEEPTKDPIEEPIEEPKPEWTADILDVVFNEDGTAKNIAPTPLEVKRIQSNAIQTTFQELLGRYVTFFNNPLGGTATGYYRVDYGDHPDIMEKISDGHSLEAVVRLAVPNNGASDIEYLASHEAGGTGLIIANAEKSQTLTFLPHIGGGYQWVTSGVKPAPGRYYHVVGVWNKSENKASIYVDGELKNTVNTSGDFKFGSEMWFCIGGDATATVEHTAWNGDIAIARIYSEPLTAERIKELYAESKVANVPAEVPFDLTDVDTIGSLRVSPGYRYYFYGKNFYEGDSVRFESLTNGKSFIASTKIEADKMTVIIPDDLVTDKYRSVLVRGNKTAELAKGKIIVSKDAPITTFPRVVAHMCDMNFSSDTYPANSLAALRHAQDANVYGIETDIHMSSDKVIFVTHDDKIDGTEFKNVHSSTLDKKKLKNGEKLPRFANFLAEAKKKPTVRVLVDVKWDSTETDMIKSGTALVKEMGMDDQVDWLIRDYSLRNTAKQYAAKNSTVMYLIGSTKYDKPVEELMAENLTPDYSYELTSKYNKATIDKIHELGGVAGVWTPDTKELVQKSIDIGVDAITTDIAETMQGLVKVYAEPDK